MALSALSYLLFLPLAAAAYYLVPKRWQNGVLLAASLWFYWLASARLALVMLATAGFVYAAGRALGKNGGKKQLAGWAIGLLCAVLAAFKYANLLAAALSLPDTFVLAMPLGISFYSFMAIGYLADVAGGKIKPEESFGQLLLFLCFFGTVSSGPILRAGSFLPQLKAPRQFSADRTVLALADLAVGLFYKVAVSDLLAVLANGVYADVKSYTGLTLFAAQLCYSFQLYFDFAGYSLLAMGSAKLFGFGVPRNFMAPYFSRSIKEFWSRWHISLSQWLRDYVYIPLGGNRKGKGRKYLNLLATFAVSGVWHGAGLGFLIWGLGHGLLQIAGEVLAPVRRAVYRALHLSQTGRLACCWQCVCTFLMVNALWVFFRAKTVGDALWVLTRQFSGLSAARLAGDFWAILLANFNPKPLLCYAFAVFLALAFLAALALDAVTRFAAREGDIGAWLCGVRPLVVRWLCYYAAAGAIFVGYLLNNGYFGTAMNFIYNNF